jgi:uncharacterized protein YydD (DUF2326 family)
MSSVKDSDIATLLEHWTEAKAEIAELEKKIEKYKRLANRVIDQQGDNTLSSTYYTLKRQTISRKTLSKRDVPVQIWEKYARSCSYPAYYLSENK